MSPQIHATWKYLKKQGIRYTHKRSNFGVKIPYTRFKTPLFTV